MYILTNFIEKMFDNNNFDNNIFDNNILIIIFDYNLFRKIVMLKK